MNSICVLAAAATINSDLLTRLGRDTHVPAMEQVSFDCPQYRMASADTVSGRSECRQTLLPLEKQAPSRARHQSVEHVVQRAEPCLHHLNTGQRSLAR